MTRPLPIVTPFWDGDTGSWQYVIHDPATLEGAVIDPVQGFDPASGATSHGPAEEILAFIDSAGLKVGWVLDTHPHADHFSDAPWLAGRLGARTATGARVIEVQRLWSRLYNLPGLPCDGREWDRLLHEGEEIPMGELPIRVMDSPGHTLASVTFLSGDAAFVHDTLMMPDVGTARADFPGGSSAALYRSLRALLDLPAETRLYVGHDYAEGRGARCMATVAEHQAENIHLKDQPDEEAFCRLRDEKDATLPLPKLMLAALQVNIRGGRLPEPEGDGHRYLKIPLDRF